MRNIILSSLIVSGLLFGGLARAQTEADKPPVPKVQVGDVAPDFTLKDQEMKDVSLSEFRGKKNVILAFYIFAFTGG